MTLYANSSTKVVFDSPDDQSANSDIKQITASEAGDLKHNEGYAIDSSASYADPDAVVTPTGYADPNAAPVAPTVTPDASVSTSAIDPNAATQSSSDPQSTIVSTPVSTDPNVDASVTGSSTAQPAPVVASDAPASEESPDPRLPKSDDLPSTTQTFVTDPVSGETVVQTDSQNPVAVEAPIPVPTAQLPQGAEAQATAMSATIEQRAGEIASTPVAITAADGSVTTGVVVDPTNHSNAKDYFAGLMAKLHAFEDESVAELKADLRAIGTLLHLHSQASHDAEQGGNYTAGDTQD
jgi:hypothetical protein